MNIITISSLGKRGRVGNCLFQYCLAKGYARAMGAELQTPADWWGRTVFTVAAADPVISVTLPGTLCDSVDPVLGSFIGRTNCDLFGYFQNDKFLSYYSRADARQWLALKPEFEKFAPTYHEYSAMHIRRGDYEQPPFNKLYCTISHGSYDTAIEQFKIPKPMMKVFENWSPASEYLASIGLPWLEDFLVFRNADFLLRANSSFSWWAGTLGRGQIYSPVVETMVGPNFVKFVPGNHPNLAGRFRNHSDLHLKEE